MKLFLACNLLLSLFTTTTAKGGAKKLQKLSLQELQSPAGPRHSDGIIFAPDSGISAVGTSAGLVTFANDLVVPGTGGFDGGKPAGTQTGHCVQVWDETQLACYFNFNLEKGRILAEALFDLTSFPSAELVITGGSGDYLGIVGTGVTRAPEDFDGTTFFYDFEFKVVK